MSAYYNENDPYAAAWLRELIKTNLIASGEVDERSIEEVKPEDVRGFRQCHFFAGIGVWSYALRNAGWPDDSPVWTGSCPCQGFSASGQRGGFSDKRHLWPAWFRLIRESRPVVVFGEQVSSKDGLAWFDVVSADLEDEGYTVGALDTCAAGVGAPHIRQRLYFVGHTERSASARFRPHSGKVLFKQKAKGSRLSGASSSVGYTIGHGSQRGTTVHIFGERRQQKGRTLRCADGTPTNGFWSDAEWIYCKDGKYRPTKPGIFPLAHGVTGRVGLLRGAGNALCAPVAQAFIESYLETSVARRS